MNHQTILETAVLAWPDEQACRLAASRLAAARPHSAIVTLQGELGAGKSTFVRHLLQAMGMGGRVKSPTYAILELYEVDGPVAHFDFFRFTDPQEWEDAGFRDVFAAPGLKLCEWPQKAGAMLPLPDLELDIAIAADDSRQVQARAHSALGVAMLRSLQNSRGL